MDSTYISPVGRADATTDTRYPGSASSVPDTSTRNGITPDQLTTAPLDELLSPDILHSPTVNALIGHLHSYYPDADEQIVRQAYAVAFIAHEGQKRRSGDPYIDHPVAVASILLDLQVDAGSIAAALLHDVVEDTGVSLAQLEQLFGAEIAHLVDGVTKLSVLEARSKEEAQAGTYRKMFIAMADDPRVVLIKLADRLHNMRTLGATSQEQQGRVARETLEIYAPLAHRLGIWQIKSELEDLSFKTLQPEKYREIAQQLMLRREARERIVQRVMARLRQTLDKECITASISGRPKHIYSIYRKMERKGVNLDQIFDLLAVRVIVNEVSECYRVLGIVHNIWKPILSEFDDYIAVPKESMYRSLHTTVLIPGGTPCEVQIRTEEMHEVADHGIAAHWRYKEGFGRNDTNFETKLTWLRGLIEWRREMTDAREFVESLKSDVFQDQVYVFTPKGKIIDLPVGSTPVDFAYRIHSEVGHRCVGAKINGRLVSLDHQLRNGEIIQIMTSKAPRGPSRDWLNFVETSSARNHIRRYFRRQERDENIAAGRDLLEKELKRLGLATMAFDEIVSIWGARSTEDLFALIGGGETTARQVVQKVLAQQTEPHDDELALIPNFTPSAPPRTDENGIKVRGAGGVLTRLARCCNPVAGEPIVGYVTRGKGITIHRADCRTVVNERNKERLIDVSWGDESPRGYPVPIRIESWDRVGLWRDISSIIADAEVNIEEVHQVPVRKQGRTMLVIQITIQSLDQLTLLLDKINRIPNVIEARRESQGSVPATA
ncbi:MAG: RelA/SpoT family protein [Chloroflexaceae bacterium]